jgi:uncharacterized membrane protein
MNELRKSLFVAPSSVLRSWKSIILIGGTLLYPPLIYVSLQHWGAGAAGLLLATLLILKGLSAHRPGLRALYLLCGGVLALGALVTAELAASAALYYPVIVNAVLGVIFVASLVKGPSVIWRMASSFRSAPPEAKSYCDRVTLVWAAFFCCNGCAALWTVLHGDLALWTLYNGAISYVLMGLLFAGEFAVRQRVKRVLGNL